MRESRRPGQEGGLSIGQLNPVWFYIGTNGHPKNRNALQGDCLHVKRSDTFSIIFLSHATKNVFCRLSISVTETRKCV